MNSSKILTKEKKTKRRKETPGLGMMEGAFAIMWSCPRAPRAVMCCSVKHGSLLPRGLHGGWGRGRVGGEATKDQIPWLQHEIPTMFSHGPPGRTGVEHPPHCLPDTWSWAQNPFGG